MSRNSIVVTGLSKTFSFPVKNAKAGWLKNLFSPEMREVVLVNSCDAIIAISGGSGTLTEMAIAYQSNIPIVVMSDTGGWAEKLGGTYIDGRNRLKAEIATTPQEAVAKVLEIVQG